MKLKRFSFLFLILAASLILTSCTTAGPSANNWPGLMVDQDTIYVANGATGVHAFRLDSNQPIWTYPEKANAQAPIWAMPVINGDNLIVGNFGKVLVNLDPKTGKEKWTYTEATGRYIGGALVEGGSITVPDGDGTLYNLDMTGQTRWKYKAKQMLWAQSVSDGKTIYQAGMDHFFYAVNLNDGKAAWEKPVDIGAAAMSSPLLTRDGLLIQGTLGSELVALDAKNGSIVGRHALGGMVWSTPVLLGDTMYVADFLGKVYALAPDAGMAEKWAPLDLGEPVIASGAVFGGDVVFVTEKGTVQAVSADGKKGWSHKITGKLYTTPVVMGDKLIVAVTAGDGGLLLVALDKSGSEVWSYKPSK